MAARPEAARSAGLLSRMAPPSIRLAELVSAMSLVSDLGMGRPSERVLRQTVVALRLADKAGLPAQVKSQTYYTSLLMWLGCAVDTSDLAELFGDETQLYAETHDGDLGGAAMAAFVLRRLGRGGSGLRRVGMVGEFFATGGGSVEKVMRSHCQAASDFAERLDLGQDVSRALTQAFERWDGRGVPGDVKAEDLALPIRLAQIADNIEHFHHATGPHAALDVVRDRRGTQFDPDLADCFLAHHDDVLAGLDDLPAWEEIVREDPQLGVPLTQAQVDVALEAFADFADLKSPSRTGNSRAVARLAEAAAKHLSMHAEDVRLVRRAALVHDLGMVGVPSTIWESTKPWTRMQRERAQTHPYLAERMLAHVPGLSAVARCAGMHHERLDGSGYPHGLSGAAIPMTARVLAAADVFVALQQPRPHRPAYSTAKARQILLQEVRDGKLDGDAVEAVLAAAGERGTARRRPPNGLTEREVEVLLGLARGLSNPEIAAEMSISRKTVSSHLEHIFTKLGVKTRTQAALFAMREGLTEV
ncbi:HD domain-containing phosphohydrolase [Smaragdicoccus niigatensis]|uniref:HD domain-containing phosphohydrolase n=1 Tax=Smaragdicoccus niigatensis TaxID=359359 RepID=UPI001C3F1A8F|nr:HD domain-containing phosphohydrolase [Smaragdicoccus niigatensis]